MDVVVGPGAVGAGDVQAPFAGGEGRVGAGAVEADGGDVGVDVAGAAAVLEEGQGQGLCPWTPPRARPWNPSLKGAGLGAPPPAGFGAEPHACFTPRSFRSLF